LSTVRQSDTVARVGGDEFIVLLNNLEDLQNATIAAKKILAALLQPFVIFDQPAEIGGSIGIAIFPDHSRDTEKLIAYADDAMYRIKKSGKNSYAFYDPDAV
jgi:diguanylate cyclase (GGDEF)-like protein